MHRVKSGKTLSPSGRMSCPAGESEAHFLRYAKSMASMESSTCGGAAEKAQEGTNTNTI